MVDLYENIKSLCTERGISVSKMCVDIGVSKSLMSNIKNHRAGSLSAKSVARISEYLGVSPEVVLYGKQMNDETVELLQQLRDEDRALLDVARGMTPEQVMLMTEFARKMRGDG